MESPAKRQLVQSINFGDRVAEHESHTLANYFVPTGQYQQVVEDEVDIVYGDKGSGKTAIYLTMLAYAEHLRLYKQVIVVAGENPHGTPVFKGVVEDPPTTEREFELLWKLYILTLIGVGIIQTSELKVSVRSFKIVKYLKGLELLDEPNNLKRILGKVIKIVRGISFVDRVETGMTIDPHSGLPTGVNAKFGFKERDIAETVNHQKIDEILEEANSLLTQKQFKLWVMFDRLDVTFNNKAELEANALRALFRVYLNLLKHESIRIKIFLRTDIWEGLLTDRPFREASHITRHSTISWNKNDLLNLVVRRLLANDSVCEAYQVSKEDVLSSIQRQFDIFYRIYQSRLIFTGDLPLFDWIYQNSMDGKGSPFPRVIIHFLAELRAESIKRYALGESPPPNDEVFFVGAYWDAIKNVSKARLEQTVFAEHVKCKILIKLLKNRAPVFTMTELALIWRQNVKEIHVPYWTERLLGIGFFALDNKSSAEQLYRVPPLYQYHLGMITNERDFSPSPPLV